MDQCEIFFGHRITAKHIVRMSNLKWIHLGTSGYEKIDLNYCEQNNICVTNSSTLLAESVASHAISFLFTMLRWTHFNLTQTDSSYFSRKNFDQNFERILTPSITKVLIFGSGQASIKLSGWLASLGFHVGIVSLSNRIIPNLAPGILQIQKDMVEEILHDQDYIINLLPFRTDTYNYFDQEKFARFSKKTNYISVGRGKTTDEVALLESLSLGQIGGAGIDVFSSEPLNSSSALFKCKNLLMTPHVAAMSKDYWENQTKHFLKNLESYSSGLTLQDQITRS
jgi:D-2-hydroxyacid dehydrogenase (NADP+)